MIGAGMVGQAAHLANFSTLPGARVVALAELRPGLGAEAATRFDVPKVYGSHHELLADPQVEAVVVVTRRPATGPVVLDSLRAGRHVLSEKPMAHTIAQGEALVAAARTAGRRYSVGFMKRHDPGTRRFKAELNRLRASGEWGRMLMVRAWCLGGEFAAYAHDFAMTAEPRPEGLELWPVAPDWLPQALHQDYAWFLNIFVHDVNLLRFLLGATPAITAVELTRPNGRLVSFDCGECPVILEMAEIPFAHWEEGVEILFEKGRLRLHLNSPLVQTAARVEAEPAGGAIATLDCGSGWAFRAQAEAFIAEIAEGRPALADGEDSLDDLRLVEDIWLRHLRQQGAS